MTVIDSLYNCFKHWSSKGSVYIYSDLHFGDLDCYKIRCEALSKRYVKHNNLNDVESEILNTYHMYMSFAINEDDFVELCDEAQVKSINGTVHKSDTLIILGDVGDVELVRKLKAGHKVLIMGNHDKGISNYTRVVERIFKLYSEMTEDDDKYEWMLVDPTPVGGIYERTIDNRLFDEVYEGPLIISPKIILSHEPINIPYCLNIHGHCHTKIDMIDDAKHLNCCAEWINYKPVSLGEIIKNGCLKDIDDIHRCTIDKATTRKLKRKGM